MAEVLQSSQAGFLPRRGCSLTTTPDCCLSLCFFLICHENGEHQKVNTRKSPETRCPLSSFPAEEEADDAEAVFLSFSVDKMTEISLCHTARLESLSVTRSLNRCFVDEKPELPLVPGAPRGYVINPTAAPGAAGRGLL